MYRTLSLMALCIVTTGCATVDFDYDPVSICNAKGGVVEILPKAPAEGTYKVCGSITVTAYHLSSEEFTDERKRLLKEEAAKYGANAVIIMSDFEMVYNFQEGRRLRANALAIQI